MGAFCVYRQVFVSRRLVLCPEDLFCVQKAHIEQAFFLLIHVPYLQPFGDVNKRTSRVLANLPLIKAEFCPLSFLDVSRAAYAEGLLGAYELRRIELMRDVFEWAYERSCEQYRVVVASVGQPDRIRQDYRTKMRAYVRDTVRGGAKPGAAAMEEWARGTARVPGDARPWPTSWWSRELSGAFLPIRRAACPIASLGRAGVHCGHARCRPPVDHRGT
jgi:hypothetical protein